jgi:hypothetical protein
VSKVLNRLRHMHTHRLVALLAIVALLFAMTAYAAHLHHPGAKADENTHCELCLQLGSTGGPAAPPKIIVRVALVVIQREPPANSERPPSRAQSRSHRSRAPPSPHLI